MNKLDLTPIIDEYDNTVLYYFVKLILKESYNIPVEINPLRINDVKITVTKGTLNYTFKGNYFEYTYTD